jgi:hypothetical protein
MTTPTPTPVSFDAPCCAVCWPPGTDRRSATWHGLGATPGGAKTGATWRRRKRCSSCGRKTHWSVEVR